MKKTLLAALAVALSLSAAAQNKAIDRLVEKYTDAEGYTVVNLSDEAVQGILAMMPAGQFGEAKVTLDDGTVLALSDILRDISAVTAVILNRYDERFAAEVRSALRGAKYSTIASVNSEDTKVQMLAADIRRGKLRGKREIVVTMQEDDSVILARIVGQMDVEKLAMVAKQVLKN